MLRMIVPYSEWLTISRGSSMEKSPAFSNLVKLSASDETVGFIDKPEAVTDRYAVLTPTHHPFCCNALLEFVAWPYCYRRFNQGINFSYSQLEHIVFPEVSPPDWTNWSRCSGSSTIARSPKRSRWCAR